MEKKMGFFEKLKKSLSKAGNGMLGAIFAGGERVNNEFYEELEEAMIVADMGMDTAERLIDALRDSKYAYCRCLHGSRHRDRHCVEA